jgi:hypothetical protein
MDVLQQHGYKFALVINFLNDTWVPMHVIVGLFEMNEMIG